MALLGRYNSLQIVKHVEFGLYLDGGADGEILLPKRYIPKDTPTEIDDWLNVFIYLDSEDQLIATTEKPKLQVGGFASLKVKDINNAGIFFDWGLSKDLLMPYSEESRPLKIGDYCVVHAYLDKRTRRITATARLDRYLDRTPADYSVGQPVELLVAGETPMGFKAIINSRHWGLIHKNEVFKFLRSGMHVEGFIKEVRHDGKIALSLQPVGKALGDSLQEQIMARLQAEGGTLAVCDKSDPQLISQLFNVSKGNFKKAIGALFKQGRIVIHDDRIEQA
ncbi:MULTISPECIES: S1 RNA-binding domain-containing protein [Pseudomonas]|uniref:CvfB family protein n=1 Tax=Pseudomonas TaxID=286 RepID=UPI0018AA5939|nr:MULTISPECIES: S1-like domain-containing RNA-binding protein [Pseudomonas]MBF8748482.1 GntR family transcriptional regulator [Pseudomonas monteilii]MCT8167438.1 GntR family transcriptional regulator [Pseudomonas sp. HD6422]MCT8186344.1 GntR family transcriptional regulator [Pseudomonas sp. HD6421]